jgi:Ca-activated chloride channel family protein
MQAGGSTNGASGIELAYQLARSECSRGDNCRVLLATDGDFNVGVTDEGSLVRLIERERDAGVFLTVLGFGMGNLNDSTMEQLADHGNGSYAYIDTLREARKVLVDQAAQTLRTVAKDTKIQIEWNPARVERYRLIGYVNRRLNDGDFNDDKKDAGEMGDGQSVTALYEIELHGAGGDAAHSQIDPLKYQAPRTPSAAAQSGELLTVKVRYKEPDAAQSRLVSAAVGGDAVAFARASDDTRFAAAVAGFGMLLQQSQFAGALSFADVERIARGALGADRDGYRHEFLELVARARGTSVEHVRRD